MSSVSFKELKQLFLKQTPLIDVRAPVEFSLGTLPGAINLPILDDVQRTAVGTAYKKLGRDEALSLGHRLVSGEVKEERLRDWTDYIQKHPNAVLFCFRGGLRSKITQSWLSEIGMNRPLIEGGYKMGRQFLRETIEQNSQGPFLIISGPTGSAKTSVLRRASHFYPTLDLEALARHRGSAFGAMAEAQPTQINFEHTIATEFLQLSPKSEFSNTLIEDESRLIGRCAIPDILFAEMRASPLVYLEESFDQRVENIFQDYVLMTPIGGADNDAAIAQFAKFKHAIKMISRKLGGTRTQDILNDIACCENDYLKMQSVEKNRQWIAKLLNYYYDPAYSKSLAKRNPKILIRGKSDVILDYIKAANRRL